MHPEDLKYSETHEWVRVADTLATVGITDHAQSELGDVVYVELPAVGASVKKGEIFGSIESVKTVSDLVAPVSGTVAKVNDELTDAPEMVNENPHTSGWLIEINMENSNDLEDMMSPEQYEIFIQEH